MKSAPEISDAEWEVMKCLWGGPPVTVNDLCERLAPAKRWHCKTVRTMLIRLAKKGAVDNNIVNGVYHYFPIVSRESCSRLAAESLLDRVFDGALTPMVAQLVKRRPLTADDKRELKRLLSEK